MNKREIAADKIQANDSTEVAASYSEDPLIILVTEALRCGDFEAAVIFGDKTAQICLVIISKIISYLFLQELNLVVPLVCRLWHDAVWTTQESSSADQKPK